MKFPKFIFVFFLFSLSFPVFPQARNIPDNAENNPAASVAKIRAERIKADILREIQTFSRREQAHFYAQLGNIIWHHDRKEGLYWLTRGVETGIDPAIEYKDNGEKLSDLRSLLFSVLEVDENLSNKIISKIKEIKIDESNLEVLERANKIYILMAQQILHLKDDETVALEFAMLSLKGKKPAINNFGMRFLLELSTSNEKLANTYFNELIEAAKTNKYESILVYYFFSDKSDTISKLARSKMTDSQIKVFLELMFPSIQKESDALRLNKINHCQRTGNWGLQYLEDYKKHLPEKAPIIEKAITVCRASGIENWKKPGFFNEKGKTSQDYLNVVKEISDKQIRTNFLNSAAQMARIENNYRLSIDILESIDKEFRQGFWIWSQIETYSKWIEGLLKNSNFDEIKQILKNAPQEYRPFIIIRSLNSTERLQLHQTQFISELMNQARADFNKIEQFSPDFALNPTLFGHLTQLNVKFGFYDEAIAIHKESIGLLNRVVKTLPAEDIDKNNIPLILSYSSFTIFSEPQSERHFIDRNFDRIYENIGTIENHRIRLSERIGFFRKNLEQTKTPILIPGSLK